METFSGNAPVDDEGKHVFFTDSGAVPGSNDYTTLVILHGLGFNGAVFQKLLPMCHETNVRLVIVNRRPYGSSSDFSDEERDELAHKPEAFMQRIAAELARFLVWFVETHTLPAISPDGTSGGLAVMGWSLGVASAMSLLGQPDGVPQPAYDALAPYLRQVILYDPPMCTLGLDPPEGGYFVFQDPLCTTMDEKLEQLGFGRASTYYTHKPPPRSLADYDMRRSGDRSSLANMTADELKVMLEPRAILAEIPIIAPSARPVLAAQTERALFDMARVPLPRAEIVHMWCEMTPWDLVWTAATMQDRIIRDGCSRPAKFVCIPGANHFLHWDDPPAFWRSVVDVLYPVKE